MTWRTIDFKPDANVAWVDNQNHRQQGAGYLIQENEHGERRVIAAALDTATGEIGRLGPGARAYISQPYCGCSA